MYNTIQTVRAKLGQPTKRKCGESADTYPSFSHFLKLCQGFTAKCRAVESPLNYKKLPDFTFPEKKGIIRVENVQKTFC